MVSPDSRLGTVGIYIQYIYITKIVVLVSEPVRGRSRATELPCFYHILGLNLNISYQIAYLFHMYIDMGERIGEKEDRPSLIIEDPLRAPKIAPKYIFFFSLVNMSLVVNMSPL